MISIDDEIYTKVDEIYSESKSFEVLSDLEFMHARFSVLDNDKISNLSKEDKVEFLRRLIEDEATVCSYKFIDYLVESNKVHYLLGSDFNQFVDFYQKNIEEKGEILFYAPVDLSEEFKKKTKEKLSHFFGSDSRVVYLVDNDLIAGCKINFRNKVYDLSLKNRYPRIIGKYLT